jgi:hypothetical protein
MNLRLPPVLSTNIECVLKLMNQYPQKLPVCRNFTSGDPSHTMFNVLQVMVNLMRLLPRAGQRVADDGFYTYLPFESFPRLAPFEDSSSIT